MPEVSELSRSVATSILLAMNLKRHFRAGDSKIFRNFLLLQNKMNCAYATALTLKLKKVFSNLSHFSSRELGQPNDGL